MIKLSKKEKVILNSKALELLYNEATKDSGDDPSDEIELAYLILFELIESVMENEND